MNKRLGLYLHIPFCLRKCGYCDFYSVTQTDLLSRFVKALCAQIRRAAAQADGAVDTVFFGGGTPSLLPPEELERILDAVRAFPLCGGAEISLELNPATADLKKLQSYRALGVNRVSVGMQSANEDELRWLGRIHTHADTQSLVNDLVRAGFDNYNLDLIYGLEGQTEDKFLFSVASAIDLEPTHLSLYALTLSESVPLWKRRGSIAPDAVQEGQYRLACAQIGQAGLWQYEISNFSVPERECAHNLKYWTRAPYLGFGPGASSFYSDRRYETAPDLNAFLERPAELVSEIQSCEALSETDALGEELMLSLRLCRGLDARGFADRIPDKKRFLKEARALTGSGFAAFDGKTLSLTNKGFFVSNELIARLMLAAGL